MGMIRNLVIGTYQIKKKCNNCDKETVIAIPKGRTIKEHFSNNQAKCSYCGCVIPEDK